MVRRRVVSAVATLIFTFTAGCAVGATELDQDGTTGKLPDEVDRGGAKPGDDDPMLDAGTENDAAANQGDGDNGGGGEGDGDADDGDTDHGDDANGDGSAGDGDASDGDSAGDGDGGDDGPVSGDAVQLPFAVDAHFVPSGYMGDGTVDTTSVVMTPLSPNDDKTCAGDRASPMATGYCHVVTYKPTTAEGAFGWAGVYWQANLNDWGTKPGVSVERGAERIVFYAKGKHGGEVITVGAGGIDSGLAHKDTFSKEAMITLTTSWKRYEISLSGLSYDKVLGGFKWSAAGAGASEIVFQLDDIHWE